MDRAVRILIANRPRLMRELLLATLSDQSWVEVVGEVLEIAEIPDHVHRTSPDLLVIDADDPLKRPPLCDVLLHQHPELRIIAIASQGNYGVCYWTSFAIQSRNIEPSEEGFLAAVRNLAEITPKIRAAERQEPA